MMILFLFVAVFSICVVPAHAYIDPGTGSMIFQLVIAMFFSVIFAVKTFRKKIIQVLKKLTGKSKQAKDE